MKMTIETTEKTQIAKQKNHAFGKDIYLLGCDSEGQKYWLEAPKWDCGWYWGFGYVETYTNNSNPSKSKDIQSHQHIDSSFMGQQEIYDFEKQVWKKGEYIHNIFDSPLFASTTFDESEGWILSELFKTFYNLKKSAEVFGKGSSHITTNPLSEQLIKTKWVKEINEIMIPAITAKIIEMLSPEKQG